MIAQTILQQLGGPRFIVMTGSKRLVNLGDGLRMQLSRNKTQANKLKILLDSATDTYTMVFYRQITTRKYDIIETEIVRYEMVYCDMLEDIFRSVTGLYTRL